MIHPDDIAVVILVGGAGRRIGGDKPQRMLAGQTLMERALAHARPLADRIALSVRHPGQVRAPEGVEMICDAPIDGPLGGLGAALTYARAQDCAGVMTLPCDMPFTPPDLSLRLRRALFAPPGPPVVAPVVPPAAAIAASGGRLHPVCGLWRVSSLQLLPDYVSSGRSSLRGFAEAVGFVSVDWPSEPTDPFFNVNTTEDLAEAEGRLG